MNIVILTALIASVALPSLALADISEQIEFSGFGRIVGGYLDEEGASYNGYSDSLSFSQQSLFALQSDVTITDKFSLSGQLLAHSGDDRESGIEWLYVNYEPNQNWRFKAGKLRTPFYRYSDVIDVGFTYPWLTPPQQVYSSFLFSNYEGATGTYRFNVDSINVEVEAYYGVFDGKIAPPGFSLDVDVDEIKGIIFSLNTGNLSMRAATVTSSDFIIDTPELAQLANALEFADFQENADSLRYDGNVTVYQANINYDTLDYYVAAEWVKASSDLLLIPEINGYYFSAGYNFYPFQTHVTYAVSENSYDPPHNLVPKGVASQLDQLSFAYDQVIDNLPVHSLKSLTIGIRWDFLHNMAAKAEITFLDGKPGENSFFTDINDPNFDRKATLYQIGVEWIF